jgi:hypothetical protein
LSFRAGSYGAECGASAYMFGAEFGGIDGVNVVEAGGYWFRSIKETKAAEK